MDVGAEYDHYTADITRTFPVNGRFSPVQAELYQIVYDAQEAVAKATRPGATLSDVNRAGTDVIKEGLLKLGLITDLNSNSTSILVYAWHVTLAGNECSRCWRWSEVCSGVRVHQ